MNARYLTLVLVSSIILMASACLGAAEPTELRGIWMHATQIKTRAEADAWVAKIEKAKLNAVYMLVWYWGGQAFFHSDLSLMGEGVEKGYDPLGHMVRECHARDIELHAWFVNGSYGASKPRHVLGEHPEWAVKTGGGGELWYDFGKPEVRRFQSDLMIGCLRRYDIDGLHFDYIRYGPKSCLCDHCQKEFARRYGYEPLAAGHAATFPFVASVSANPLKQPTTATVVAEFGNGLPAIATNTVGKGRVLLLNWHAERDAPAAVSATVTRALERWKTPRDKVFVMDTAPNRAKYGSTYTAAGAAWLRRLGWKARIVGDDRLASLPQGAVLGLSCVYLIPDELATGIERFVEAGGTLVVIDGPTPSIGNAALQRVLGMEGQASYFQSPQVIRATGKSDLAVSSGRTIDLAKERLREQRWAEFRAWGVTELVRDVHRRAKALKPKAQVTAAVFTPLASAKRVFQDWPG